MKETLEKLRKATRGTDYEGRLFLVGGVVRDKVMGLPLGEDIDIVLEGDAPELAQFLYSAGVADHHPVIYPRFGTAMILVDGQQVELVSARSESYVPESRKPDVTFATLDQDVLRRDFTINTLMENLHTGEIIDLTGVGCSDIEQGIIRTPTDPVITFRDDPLRMLRAVRFAARFGFTIESATLAAISQEAARLSIISGERIRDEFSKMLMTERASEGLEMLRATGLLAQFAPELLATCGVTQNLYHLYDVWTHTLKAVEALAGDASLQLRLAAVFHDVGKPGTKSVDEKGNVHFYTHQDLGADITRTVLTRLRFPNDVIYRVSRMVMMHLRIGEYDEVWSDAAVRRLIRDAGDDLRDLIRLTCADKAAANQDMPSVDIEALERRIEDVQRTVDVMTLESPLSGKEIMEALSLEQGQLVGEIKGFLREEVIEGRLVQDDKYTARQLIRERWGRK